MKGFPLIWFLIAFLSGILISGLLLLLISPKPTEPILLNAMPTEQPLTVYLSGDVPNPGVYQVPLGSRLQDLLLVSNNQSPDITGYNLAAKLYDGQHIKIEEKRSDEKQLDISSDILEKININEANLEELMQLPGIGSSKAAEIISYRETQGFFVKIEDILKVPGIGTGIFDNIKDLIVVNSIQ